MLFLREGKRVLKKWLFRAVSNSKFKCCGEISESDKETLFNRFWTKINWDQKKMNVKTFVLESEIKTKRDNSSGRKAKTYQYYFTIDDKRYGVCKSMFLNTLGIGEKMVYGWKQKGGVDAVDTEVETSSSTTQEKLSSDLKQGINDFLNKLS